MIVGGGYIAVEFAGIFNDLNAKQPWRRKNHILRGFDQGLRQFLQEEMIKKGIKIKTETPFQKIEKKGKIPSLYKSQMKLLNMMLLFMP